MALLLPDVCLEKITDVTPAMMRRMGVCALILDADNTLSPHGSQQPYDGVKPWLAQMRAEGFPMVMVSNNVKKRVGPFAHHLGLAFVSLACKPFPFGLRRAVRTLGVPARQVAAVGDQVFTDVLGAHMAGIRSVLLSPQGDQSKSAYTLRRAMERPVRRRAAGRGAEYLNEREDAGNGK